MNCRFCGTALPEDALFCGECGRPAVSVSGRRRAAMPKVSVGGRSASPLVAELDEPRPEPDPVPTAASVAEPVAFEPVVRARDVAEPVVPRCPQCGRAVLATDVFCGDCGFVLTSAKMPAPAPAPAPEPEAVTGSEVESEAEPPSAVPVPDARDTAAIVPADLDFTGIVVRTAPRDVALSGVTLVDADADVSVPAEGAEVEPAVDADVPEPAVEADVPEPAVDADMPEPADEEITEIADPLEVVPPESALPVAEPLEDRVPPVVEPDRLADAAPSPFAPDPALLRVAAAAAHSGSTAVAAAGGEAGTPAEPHEPADGRPLRSVPDPFPWGRGPIGGTVDLEKTRAVATGPAEERFVLQFSTGESVTVTGAGLVGRNPSSQPGEFVDQLVTIFDAGKSVSKTHLEFGQESGRFWVSDRYSTNGSTVRQPDLEPKRCEPGRRYFIARGTRVDIGEQFFVVS